MSIKGQRRNCEAAKCKIEELIKHHGRSEVCVECTRFHCKCIHVDADVSVYCGMGNYAKDNSQFSLEKLPFCGYVLGCVMIFCI